MCPKWDSNDSPRRGQRYCRGGAYARDSVLGSLTVSDHSLRLQTIVFERCKHIPLLFDRHFPLLLPEPQGHPGTKRKQLRRPNTARPHVPGHRHRSHLKDQAPGVPHQPGPGLDQPERHALKRPSLDDLGQRQPPPKVARVVSQDEELHQISKRNARMPTTARAVTASVHVVSPRSLCIVLRPPVPCRQDHRSHAPPFISRERQAPSDAG